MARGKEIPEIYEELFIACQENDVLSLETILSKGLDPNYLDEETFNRPIHVAVVNGSTSVVEILLDNPKVNPNLAGANWYQPIEIARVKKYTEIIKLFEDRNLNEILSEKPHSISVNSTNKSLKHG